MFKHRRKTDAMLKEMLGADQFEELRREVRRHPIAYVHDLLKEHLSQQAIDSPYYQLYMWEQTHKEEAMSMPTSEWNAKCAKAETASTLWGKEKSVRPTTLWARARTWPIAP